MFAKVVSFLTQTRIRKEQKHFIFPKFVKIIQKFQMQLETWKWITDKKIKKNASMKIVEGASSKNTGLQAKMHLICNWNI